MRPPAKQKPFVVPVFIPHAGCPHRCIFCDQTRTSRHPESIPKNNQIDTIIQRFLDYRQDAARFTEISFFGGNFLGLPDSTILGLLEHAARYVADGVVHGIRFSTRPDTIDPHRLGLLSAFPVSTVELGVQSMNDLVLSTSRRGHTADDTINAVALLRRKPYRLGLQMMIGLPGDTRATALATGEAIARMAPDFVRIYPTLVLKDSALARLHRKGQYAPMALEEAISQAKALCAIFIRNGIPVIRLGLQATDGLDAGKDMVAGPYHPAFGELVHSALWLDAMRREIDALGPGVSDLEIRLNPRLISQVKGHHHRNMETLKREYRLSRIDLITDTGLAMEQLQLNGRACHLLK